MKIIDGFKITSKLYYVDEDKTVDFETLPQEEKERVQRIWAERIATATGYKIVKYEDND